MPQIRVESHESLVRGPFGGGRKADKMRLRNARNTRGGENLEVTSTSSDATRSVALPFACEPDWTRPRRASQPKCRQHSARRNRQDK